MTRWLVTGAGGMLALLRREGGRKLTVWAAQILT